MKKTTIHRGTNYIKYIAARSTTANNIGDIMEAKYKGYWQLKNLTADNGITYQTSLTMIRATMGEILLQEATK